MPQSSAFARREGKAFLSVYLLDFFQQETELENVIELKKYMKEKTTFNCKPNGSFPVLNIEQSKQYIFEEISSQICHREKDLPHCGIFYDANDLLIAKLLAQCV
ncbi:hypothetical protein [Trichormus azollae]|uniref:hypothetical protein n=1 Tax=Trichormus azollae TaxID=1164 RepID=UPI00325DE1EC